MTHPPHCEQAPPSRHGAGYGLWQLVRYFLRLGTLGFGGPVALVGYMHRDLVEKRQWIGEGDYKEGLALAQLAPGPLAAQLAIYIGYVHFRVLGATLAGLAFVLPSFAMVLGLGWAYVAYGGLAWMQSVLYGVGAAVIGIIAIGACRLTVKSVGKDPLLWVIYLALAAVTIVPRARMAQRMAGWMCPGRASRMPTSGHMRTTFAAGSPAVTLRRARSSRSG